MWVVIGLTLVCAFLVASPVKRRKGQYRPLFKGTGPHWRRNYSRRSFLRLGGGIVAAGVLAYSGLDETVDGFHSSVVRSTSSDRTANVLRVFGERFWFLNWAVVGVIDAWLASSPFTRWGRRNFEAMVVGLPTLWTVQRGLGANRPSSEDGNPRWRPMNADNSASGHTFMAAIPWLTLARRSGLQKVRGPAWLASGLTGWSRINDRKHYLSQVILGWTIAWNAVYAVSDQKGDPDAHQLEEVGNDQAQG